VTPPPADYEFLPHVLREYALLADCERGALIGPHGDIAWMCLPRWHDGAVFASLIGGDGTYAVTPEGRYVWGGFYEPGTLIWHSRWITSDGIVDCREALSFPGDPHQAVIVRRLSAERSPAQVKVVLDPRDGFSGPGLSSLLSDGRAQWTGRFGGMYLRWSGDVGSARVRRASRGCWLAMGLTVHPGEHRDMVLELSPRPFEHAPADAASLWQATRARWEQEVPALPDVTATRDARHSYAILRALTSSTGGMVGAVTTSLPERAVAGRNYDYRYVWIRDQCFAGQAAAAAGGLPLLDEAVRFVSQRLLADGPRLAPAYTVTGDPVPDQRQLGLPGYPGGFDIVGNWVNKQFQLDVFGEALLLFATAAERGRLESHGWRAAEIAASAIAARWHEPDAGIWETENQAWTHSRLICVAGLRAVAATRRSAKLAAAWSGLADVILANTAIHATHPSGRWQRSPADPGVDGALLLPPLRGALPASDPRTVGTLRAYASELTEDGYAYRFRHGGGPLADAEGAFLFCGFLLALAFQQQGDDVTAARWFERNRAACGPAALYSEEYDVGQRQLRGNLPQAFVHALMLECAARLAGPVPAAPPPPGRISPPGRAAAKPGRTRPGSPTTRTAQP
jgi:alpha,alpha-trehalase